MTSLSQVEETSVFLVVMKMTLRRRLRRRLWFATLLLATKMGNQWLRLAGVQLD